MPRERERERERELVEPFHVDVSASAVRQEVPLVARLCCRRSVMISHFTDIPDQ